MALAVEQVRRMRGGAQSQLMRCSNGQHYVVKFQNNPQGLRILANELLGTRLAARLGLSVAEPEVVEVRAELIAHTDDLVIQLGRGRAPCKAGKQFGSRYPGNLADTAVYDFLPDEQLREVSNIEEFCGMLVFDKWTCNTNGRQAIFYRDVEAASPGASVVKAFNTTFASALVAGRVGGLPLDVFLAGDDEHAKAQGAALVRDGGMRPVDTGPLRRARELEAFQLLHMTLQGPLGLDWASAVKLLP